MAPASNNLSRVKRVIRSLYEADGRQIRGYVARLGLNIEYAYYIARTLKFVRSPYSWLKRKSLFLKIQKEVPTTHLVGRKSGFVKLPPNALPGTKRIVRLIHNLAVKRKNTAEWWDPFQKKIFLPEDLIDYPEVLDLVLSDEVLHIACEYLSTVPVLQSVQAWWSPKNEYLQNSQLYHRDNMDWRELKFFINVSDVGTDNGPLTFLPANVSLNVSKKLENWRRSIPDEEMYRLCSPNDSVEAVGPAGSCCVVDSGRCFHFGARTQEGERMLLMFNFASYYAAMNHQTPLQKTHANLPDDPLRRLVLGLN